MKEVLKKYLIPHKENDYKPHILSAETVAFVCMVALVAEAVFVFGTTYVTPNSKLFGIITVNALVDETNQSRTANTVSALRTDPLLQAAAQAKANDMATKGYFAHTSPTGVTPWFWFEQAGYSFAYAGENLAVNFSDSQDVTNAWMNSPEHRDNILNNNFTEIGIATAEGVYKGRPATFVVELFAAPAASPIAFVSTAAAAGSGSEQAPAVSPAATPSPTPTPVPTPTPSPTPKPATKPAPKPAAIPVIPGVTTVVLVNSTSANVTSEQTFVAVKGASTGTASGTQVGSTDSSASGASQPASAAETVLASQTPPAPQSNAFQRILSDPKKLANDFYLFLMFLFGLAVILNIFIKIRIQHPKLIFSGLLVIVVAGLCVLLNQNISLLHAAIL